MNNITKLLRIEQIPGLPAGMRKTKQCNGLGQEWEYRYLLLAGSFRFREGAPLRLQIAMVTRPSAEPAAVCSSHPPRGTSRVSTMPYAVAYVAGNLKSIVTLIFMACSQAGSD